jgi:hypothetical protein
MSGKKRKKTKTPVKTKEDQPAPAPISYPALPASVAEGVKKGRTIVARVLETTPKWRADVANAMLAIKLGDPVEAPAGSDEMTKMAFRFVQVRHATLGGWKASLLAIETALVRQTFFVRIVRFSLIFGSSASRRKKKKIICIFFFLFSFFFFFRFFASWPTRLTQSASPTLPTPTCT